METAHLPHLLSHPLHICLFTDVRNASYLREQLLAGNTDYEYAFLDASVLLSRRHVLSACFRAINDLIADRLKTRNVHSEIVFAMNPNNNVSRPSTFHPYLRMHLVKTSYRIVVAHSSCYRTVKLPPPMLTRLQIAESFRRFGIQDGSKNIVAIKVGGAEHEIKQHLLATVQGAPAALTDDALVTMLDAARIRKIYRLEAPKKGSTAQLGKEAEAFIIGSMALKGS